MSFCYGAKLVLIGHISGTHLLQIAPNLLQSMEILENFIQQRQERCDS